MKVMGEAVKVVVVVLVGALAVVVEFFVVELVVVAG